MMMASERTITTRIAKEVKMLVDNNDAYTIENVKDFEQSFDEGMIVSFSAPTNSPYDLHQRLKIKINFSQRYPFEPPKLIFILPVYHPNIDNEGRICLDLLKMPPKGTWKPTVSILSLMNALQVLLADPNPDDPLMPDIAREYLLDRELYNKKAKGEKIIDTNSSTLPSSTTIIEPATKSLLSLGKKAKNCQ